MDTHPELTLEAGKRVYLPPSGPAFSATRLVCGLQSPDCWWLALAFPLEHCLYHLGCWNQPWRKPKFVEKVGRPVWSYTTIISWGGGKKRGRVREARLIVQNLPYQLVCCLLLCALGWDQGSGGSQAH
jgi:hypothetical protein